MRAEAIAIGPGIRRVTTLTVHSLLRLIHTSHHQLVLFPIINSTSSSSAPRLINQDVILESRGLLHDTDGARIAAPDRTVRPLAAERV